MQSWFKRQWARAGMIFFLGSPLSGILQPIPMNGVPPKSPLRAEIIFQAGDLDIYSREFFKGCKTYEDIAWRVASRIFYQRDIYRWKIADHFQTPGQTIRSRKGDCEDGNDLARLGVLQLKSASQEARDTVGLFRVFVRHRGRQTFGHAVCAWKEKGFYRYIDFTEPRFNYFETAARTERSLARLVHPDATHWRMVVLPRYDR